MTERLSNYEQMIKHAVEQSIGKRLRNKDLVAWSTGVKASYVNENPDNGEHYTTVTVERHTIHVNYTLPTRKK